MKAITILLLVGYVMYDVGTRYQASEAKRVLSHQLSVAALEIYLQNEEVINYELKELSSVDSVATCGEAGTVVVNNSRGAKAFNFNRSELRDLLLHESRHCKNLKG